MRDVVIWGLCDAACAALFYAPQDARVSGVVLANPWVRTTQGEARTYLKHYYLPRLFSAAPWRKLLRGELDLAGSAASLARNFRQAGLASEGATLAERMAAAAARFRGRILLILSGDDLTAKEFVDASDGSARWRALLKAPRLTRHVLAEANHTFSRREWRDQVAAWTASWLPSW